MKFYNSVVLLYLGCRYRTIRIERLNSKGYVRYASKVLRSVPGHDKYVLNGNSYDNVQYIATYIYEDIFVESKHSCIVLISNHWLYSLQTTRKITLLYAKPKKSKAATFILKK